MRAPARLGARPVLEVQVLQLRAVPPPVEVGGPAKFGLVGEPVAAPIKEPKDLARTLAEKLPPPQVAVVRAVPFKVLAGKLEAQAGSAQA